jgi:hypothetical protein
MLNYHKAAKKSIGDGQTQMEFLVHQLSNSYKSVWTILQNASSIREASDAVLLKFERPADQSETAQSNRAKLGQTFYDKYHTEAATKPVPPADQPEIIFKEGDLVVLANDAVYYNGKTVPAWVRAKAWYVKANQVGDRVIIDKSEDGANSINSPINASYLSLKKPKKESFAPYLVKVTVELLNYRSGPSTSYKVNGMIKKGEVYTIVDEKDGWGKLKSGAGWICLDYVKKI